LYFPNKEKREKIAGDHASGPTKKEEGWSNHVPPPVKEFSLFGLLRKKGKRRPGRHCKKKRKK